MERKQTEYTLTVQRFIDIWEELEAGMKQTENSEDLAFYLIREVYEIGYKDGQQQRQ